MNGVFNTNLFPKFCYIALTRMATKATWNGSDCISANQSHKNFPREHAPGPLGLGKQAPLITRALKCLTLGTESFTTIGTIALS